MPLPQLLSIVESLGEFRELLGAIPAPSARAGVGGLHGSSDAVVVATLARNLTHRFFVVLNDDVASAERWLADLSTLVEPEASPSIRRARASVRQKPTRKSRANG